MILFLIMIGQIYTRPYDPPKIPEQPHSIWTPYTLGSDSDAAHFQRSQDQKYREDMHEYFKAKDKYDRYFQQQKNFDETLREMEK